MAKDKTQTTDTDAETTGAETGDDRDQHIEHDVDEQDPDDLEFSSDLDSMYDSAVDEADVEPKHSKASDAQAGDETSDQPAGTDGQQQEEPPTPGEAPAQPDTPAEAGDQAAPQSQEATQPEPAAQAPEQIDPQQVVAQYNQWRDQAETLLAQRHYALTEEQAQELDDNPSKAIPKLAARLHMEVLQQATAAAMRLVPQLMQEAQSIQSVRTERETEFFQEWPELQKHRDDVVRFGNAYLSMNPNATFEDFKRDVGAQVAVARRVDLSARQQQAAAAAGNGAMAPAPAPKPLAARSAGSAPAPSKPTNPFEALDQQFEELDSDY